MEVDPPKGMWAATGTVAAKAPTLTAIRRGSFREDGWSSEGQQMERERRLSRSETGGSMRGLERRLTSGTATTAPIPVVKEEGITEEKHTAHGTDGPSSGEKSAAQVAESSTQGISQYANGYIPPPKLPWTTSTAIGLKAFWRWFLTPWGFLITVYGLNVVAWGGMLFLLLCNAAPAMCHPSCNDLYSPRRIWIEIDSQILNALFCVTGFGLIPWRFRDLYYLMVWRLGIRGRSAEQRAKGMRTLAGIHRDWFRLEGSDKLPVDSEPSVADEWAMPFPLSKAPDPPPTGIRAPPTAGWKMDFVVWCFVWNTFLQACLSGFMWGYNRFDRPSWSTGLFVALACIVAGVAGIMMFLEGKRVKKVEGVPPSAGSTTAATGSGATGPLQNDVERDGFQATGDEKAGAQGAATSRGGVTL
jgi:hypothetical protein